MEIPGAYFNRVSRLIKTFFENRNYLRKIGI